MNVCVCVCVCVCVSNGALLGKFTWLCNGADTQGMGESESG